MFSLFLPFLIETIKMKKFQCHFAVVSQLLAVWYFDWGLGSLIQRGML